MIFIANRELNEKRSNSIRKLYRDKVFAGAHTNAEKFNKNEKLMLEKNKSIEHSVRAFLMDNRV